MGIQLNRLLTEVIYYDVMIMKIKSAYIIILLICLLYNVSYSESGIRDTLSIEKNNNSQSLTLFEPRNRSLLHNLTPTFRWQEVEGENIEYRIIIAEWNGKIILDQWVGSNTSYKISKPNILTDLNVYVWSVSVYRESHRIRSVTNSFGIDLDISLDLEIKSLKLLSNKQKWECGDIVRFEVEVLNCGPSGCLNPKVILYNGNINQNYLCEYAIKKTRVLDSTIIKNLESGLSYKIELQGKLSDGLNHIYAEVKTDKNYRDIFQQNNSKAGPILQTVNDKWQLKGLFLIYSGYRDPASGIRRISEAEHNSIFQNILDTQQFFWDHTQVVKIKVDTLHINRVLTDNDFTYIDENWGYVLGPWDIEYDLRKQDIAENEYDFVFAYYAWHNSIYSWSGYSGYAYKVIQAGFGISAYAAQPISHQVSGTAEITIHEILHIIDHFYKKGGNEKFYYPDEKERVTTFVDNMDYYEWILETWPSRSWFDLNWGKKITTKQAEYCYSNQIPQALSLSQNYPNPFNNSTVITYELPDKNSFAGENHVTLKIYSIIGEHISTLVDNNQKPGIYSVSWNGSNNSGELVSSGIYFYKIRIGDKTLTKKLLLIK